MTKITASLFLMFLIISGCRDEVSNSGNNPSEVSKGAYVLSEGGFSAGSSKLSFYNVGSNSFSENIFHPSTLGLFPDGLIINNSKLYLLEQGNYGAAGKIYRLDTSGAVEASSNIGVNPYSLAMANNKIYVTNGAVNSVSVVDPASLQETGTIPVGIFPQEILSLGSKVFVCNTSVFQGATDSTVTVIDAATDQVVATIRVRQTPSSLAVTNDGKLLIGCPGVGPAGVIYKYDPSNYSRLDSFIISNGFASGFDRDICVDPNSNYVYFLCYLNHVVRLNLATKYAELFIVNSNPSSQRWNGYSYDSRNNKHYVANAMDYVTAGRFMIFDGSGSNTGAFTTGISPRRIVIKN